MSKGNDNFFDDDVKTISHTKSKENNLNTVIEDNNVDQKSDLDDLLGDNKK